MKYVCYVTVSFSEKIKGAYFIHSAGYVNLSTDEDQNDQSMLFDIFADHKYLWQIIATAIGTLMFCHFSLYLGTSLKLLDIPDEKAHSFHAVAVPLTGGIAVFISLIAGSLVGAFFLPADPIAGSSFTRAWFSSAMFGMLFLGLVDDRHQQSPRMRLICMLTLCATTVLLPVDLTIHSLQLPLLGWTLQLGAWIGPFMIL